MTAPILEVYTLDTLTGTYTRIGELVTYTNLSWNEAENKACICSFTINVYSTEGALIQPFKNWILIKREGSSPVLFNIADIRGGINENSGQIRVVCMSMLYSLMQLYVEGAYKQINVDAGTIASDLIAMAQSKPYGNLGIQDGTIEAVGETNETLFYQSIGQALVNQSDNIVGYKFFFQPILDANQELDYVQFNILKNTGVVRDNLPPLELGFSVNVLDFGMAGEVYNKIYELGAGTGDVEVATSDSEVSKAAYALRESVTKEADVFVKATLQTKADAFINENQVVKLEVSARLTPGIKPYYGDFGLSDSLQTDIKIGNTFFNFEGLARVKELEFQYDDVRNQERISVIFEYIKI